MNDMNMIKEDYVSFETAKLLKDKGFNIPTRSYRILDKKHISTDWKQPLSEGIYLPRPTLQMAMKWLREVHRIEAHVVLSQLNTNDTREYMYDLFSNTVNRDFKTVQSYGFETYEQACESAIKYCLENLI